MMAITRSAAMTPSSMSRASSLASATEWIGTLRTSMALGMDRFLSGGSFSCGTTTVPALPVGSPVTASTMWSRLVMTARPPPCSTKRQAASTLGPIDPLAKWPSAASARISPTVTRPTGAASGVPKRSTACGTSVAMTSTSTVIDRASRAAPRSLSMTASTPVSVPSSRRTTGMPPPPLAITTKPASTRACTAGASTTSSGSGEATTRRQPLSPRSCHVSPWSTRSRASSAGR